MKSQMILLSLSTVVSVFSAMSASAADESELAQRSGCLTCHGGIERKIGPPYRDVATKYAAQVDAETALSSHIVKGTGPSGVGWMKNGKAVSPFMPPNAHVSPEDAVRLARWILTVTGEVGNPSKFVTETLTVTGAVEHPLSLGVDDLRKLPLHQINDLPLICRTGETLGKLGNLKGVLLRDIIEKAVIVAPGHNDVKEMIIIATASDGYKAVFSWAEVFITPIGDGVLVFFEKDGKPLDDSDGRIAMLSVKDTRTGPRHVKWLKSIEIRKVGG